MALLTAPKNMPLAARIRWARQEAGYSQERFAERVGTSRRHVIKWEKGTHRPSRRYIARIAEATGQPEKLFTDEDDEEADLDLEEVLRRRVSLLVRQVLEELTPSPPSL